MEGIVNLSKFTERTMTVSKIKDSKSNIRFLTKNAKQDFVKVLQLNIV